MHALSQHVASESLTPLGWLACFVIFTVLAALGDLAKKRRAAKGLPPREPLTDFSPGFRDLMTGYRHAAYTAPVRAVTPGGIQVSYGRCCRGGHVSPKQAADHAGRIAQRITATGR